MSTTADVPVSASRLSAWLNRLGDRSNPLLLRLVRQELRNRTFLVVFNLLLLVSAGVSMLVAAGAEADSRVGMKLLAVLCGADRVGAVAGARLEPAGGAIAQVAFAPRAIAHCRILPEGADLIDQRQAMAARHGERGHGGQHRRVGVEDVGLELAHQRVEPGRRGGDLGALAQQRRAPAGVGGAVEEQALGLLGVGAGHGVARGGQVVRLDPHGAAGAHERAGAEAVARMERQRMVEDVEDARHSGAPSVRAKASTFAN